MRDMNIEEIIKKNTIDDCIEEISRRIASYFEAEGATISEERFDNLIQGSYEIMLAISYQGKYHGSYVISANFGRNEHPNQISQLSVIFSPNPSDSDSLDNDTGCPC